jgi:hypothetical protein
MIRLEGIYKERSETAFYAIEAFAGIGVGATISILLSYAGYTVLVPLYIVSAMLLAVIVAWRRRSILSSSIAVKRVMLFSALNILISIIYIMVLI